MLPLLSVCHFILTKNVIKFWQAQKIIDNIPVCFLRPVVGISIRFSQEVN